MPRPSAKRFARSCERALFFARFAGVCADFFAPGFPNALPEGLPPARVVVLPVNLPAFGLPLTHVDPDDVALVDARDAPLSEVLEEVASAFRDPAECAIDRAAVPLRGGLPDLTRVARAGAEERV